MILLVLRDVGRRVTPSTPFDLRLSKSRRSECVGPSVVRSSGRMGAGPSWDCWRLKTRFRTRAVGGSGGSAVARSAERSAFWVVAKCVSKRISGASLSDGRRRQHNKHEELTAPSTTRSRVPIPNARWGRAMKRADRMRSGPPEGVTRRPSARRRIRTSLRVTSRIRGFGLRWAGSTFHGRLRLPTGSWSAR
jgi:hypothetical protein